MTFTLADIPKGGPVSVSTSVADSNNKTALTVAMNFDIGTETHRLS